MKSFWIILVTIYLFKQFEEVEMKYEVILERIENAFGVNDKFVSFESLRVKKFNKTTHVINGGFDLKLDLDDTITMTAAALNFQGNQYKMMFTKDLGKFCENLYTDINRKIYERVQSTFQRPTPWKTCPYPKGPNVITNFMIDDIDDLLPPYIPGNEKWQVQVRFIKGEEELGGYNIYAILRNERSLLISGG